MSGALYGFASPVADAALVLAPIIRANASKCFPFSGLTNSPRGRKEFDQHGLW